MKNRISYLQRGLRIPYEIFKWFVAKTDQQEDNHTYRLRLFQITSFTVFFVTSFFHFLSGLIYSYLITAATCFIILVSRHLIETRKTRQAYILLLVCLNLAMFALTLIEGKQSGTYIFFFAILISFTFITNLNNKDDLFFCFFITSLFLLASLVFSPPYGARQEFFTMDFQVHFFYNVIISFAVIAWMSIILLRDSHKKEIILKNEQLFLDTLFNNSVDGKLVIDQESGQISDCNDRSVELFQLQHKGLLNGKNAFDFFLELRSEEGRSLREKLTDPYYAWQGELTCVRQDGSTFTGQVSFVPLPFQGRHFKKISIEDVTNIKIMLRELQESKEKAEQLAQAKSLFLSNMSHELRTPLNGIIGATGLLLHDNYLPEQKENLNVLRFSSEHMLSLVNDILDLGKLEAGKIAIDKKPVSLADFAGKMESVFNNQFDTKGIPLVVKVDPQLEMEVMTDYLRLNQVMTNLLSNALKFTSRGQVEMQIAALEIRSEFVTVEFSVSDTGIGISSEKQKLIFDHFTQADLKTTRKYGGTGLGLAISKKLVDLLGGDLQVESKYSVGSRFYFQLTLPVNSRKQRVFVNAKPEFKNTLKKGIRILVAEDNPVNMMITTRFLDKWDVTYAKARNGAEAIEIFRREKFDLLLLDLEMPEVDGYRALEEIRKDDHHIPAIAFTAAVFENMKQNLAGYGFTDYIQKPFRPEDLHEKIAIYTKES